MAQDGFLGLVLIVVLVIIAVIIVIALLVRQRDQDKGTFGESCSSDSDCRDGQCLKNVCSLPKGSFCLATIECEPDTECTKGVCATTGVPIGGTCDNSNICASPLICNLGTCKSAAGGPCGNNSQCVSGSCNTTTNTCNSTTGGTSVMDLLTPMETGPMMPVLDVAGDNNNMLTLQENGSIIMDNGSTASTIYSSIKPKLICWARVAIFAISHGKLYQINADMNRLYWNWHKYPKTPKDIVHICCTLDNKYLWLETQLPRGRKRGYLYKISSHGVIKPLESKIVAGTRVYGRHKDEYAIISSDHECTVYRDGSHTQSMTGISGVGFDPETGELITSGRHKRVIKALGTSQVAIPT